MDLEQKAIERIKTASEMSLEYYKQPLICTYSGGKDSDVLLELFKLNYIRAFDRMLEARKAKNLPTQWESGEEVFLWWIEDKNVAGQREFKVAENGQLMW